MYQIEYVYLFHPYPFVLNRQNVFKIGKSKQENVKRFHSYPKGTRLLLQIECSNCSIMETTLIKKFKEKFIFRRDLGYEYFEGNRTHMLYCIYEEAMKEIERYGFTQYGNQLTSDVQDCSSDNIIDSVNEDCLSDNIIDSVIEDCSSVIEDCSSDNIIDMVVDNIVDSIVQDFSSDGVLQEKKVSSKKKHHCSYCDYNTSRLFNLTQHTNKKNSCFKINTQTKINANKFQTKINANKLQTKINANKLDNKNTFKCNVCNNIFSRKHALKEHRKRNTCNNLHALQCEICLKMFSSRSGKHQHKKAKTKCCFT